MKRIGFLGEAVIFELMGFVSLGLLWASLQLYALGLILMAIPVAIFTVAAVMCVFFIWICYRFDQPYQAKKV